MNKNIVKYIAPDKSFQISYPTEWKLQEKDDEYTLRLTVTEKGKEKPAAGVYFYSIPIPKDNTATIESIKEQNRLSTLNSRNANIINISDRNIKDYQGFFLDYTFRDTSIADISHHMFWLFEKDKSWYILQYRSTTIMDKEYLQEAKNIINSVSFQLPSSVADNGNPANSLKADVAKTDLAGSLSINVKTIDADIISPFRHGSALIKKGSSFALIDKNANIIVPYNVYKDISYKDEYNSEGLPSVNGIYEIRTSRPPYMGFINYLGKKIYAPPIGIDYVDEQVGVGLEGFGSVDERHLAPNKTMYNFKPRFCSRV